MIPLVVSAYTILPYLINNNGYDSMVYYKTLFIEPILGMYFGYAIFMSTIKDKSWINYINMISCCLLLVLLKDTGILFALVAYIAFSINQTFIIKKIGKKRIIVNIIAIISIILLFFSWKCVQKKYGTTNMYSEKVENDEIQEFIHGGNEKQIEIIEKFKYTIKNQELAKNDGNIISSNINIVYFFTGVIIFFVIILILVEKERRKIYINSMFFFLIGCILFVVGYLAVCLFTFRDVLCFPRYMSTICTAGIIFILKIICDEIGNDSKKFKILMIYFSVIILLIYPFSKEKIDSDSFKGYRDYIINISDEISENVNPKTDRIALIFGDTDKNDFRYTIYHHNICYELLDEGFIFSSYEKDDINNILQSYDYVFFIVIKNEDIDNLFRATDISVTKSTLYKIENVNNKIVLNEVN
ncbi:MAG: DUF2142 domain-containing protein [Clostridia bacterium]|nr:DUF2142 domain-containing protein [Clostridia bacterium]